MARFMWALTGTWDLMGCIQVNWGKWIKSLQNHSIVFVWNECGDWVGICWLEKTVQFGKTGVGQFYLIPWENYGFSSSELHLMSLIAFSDKQNGTVIEGRAGNVIYLNFISQCWLLQYFNFISPSALDPTMFLYPS